MAESRVNPKGCAQDARDNLEREMRTVDLIVAKRDGHAIPTDAIEAFVAGVSSGSIPDYQTSAFLMAVYFRGMETEELVAYTRAMLNSGNTIHLPALASEIKVDKHSTGGVGDKVSLTLAPMVAACGLYIPMISGRGLGHTGGTLDKLESIPGMNVELSAAEFERCVADVGFAISGQTSELVPADKKLYAMRDVTGTVPSIPLIAASIMSKKLAEGLDSLVLDVKVGSGAFMKTLPEARRLAKTMISIGEGMGCCTSALLTDMSQPLGCRVGHANEVFEAIETLRGEGPDDTTALCLALGEEMLQLAGRSQGEAKAALTDAIESGRALDAFRRFVRAQGGDPRVADDPLGILPSAPHKLKVRAGRDGTVSAFDCAAVGHACGVLGGGRATASDTIDFGVGIEVLVKIGDRVKQGHPLFKVSYRDEAKAASATALLSDSVVLSDEPVASRPLVYERLDKNS